MTFNSAYDIGQTVIAKIDDMFCAGKIEEISIFMKNSTLEAVITYKIRAVIKHPPERARRIGYNEEWRDLFESEATLQRWHEAYKNR